MASRRKIPVALEGDTESDQYLTFFRPRGARRAGARFPLKKYATHVTVCIQMPNRSTISLSCQRSSTITDVKDYIAIKSNIPRDHQILKIVGKSHLRICDYHGIFEYNKWHHSALNMMLEVISGEFCVCVLDFCTEKSKEQELFLKLSPSDTIKIVEDQIFTKLRLDQTRGMIGLCYYQTVNSPMVFGEDKKTAFLEWHHTQRPHCLHLSDDSRTLQDYNVSLFSQLFKLRVCLLHVSCFHSQFWFAKVKHVYSVQISDDLDTSHHKSNEYLLSLEYNTTANKLYSIVADLYKVSVKFVVLMVNNYQIADGDMPLHSVFYPPIILRYITHTSRLHSVHILSKFPECHLPAHCELAKKASDDPIIKEMVTTRNDAWEVMIKVFNISDDIRNKIEENSGDDNIRCVDAVHRIYHFDHDLTWEFVEIQVRREDPQLADIIRTHL